MRLDFWLATLSLCDGLARLATSFPQDTDLTSTVAWDADETFAFLQRYYGGEGDRSAPIRAELSAAERALSHPPSTSTEQGHGQGKGRADPPSSGGAAGPNGARRPAGRREEHARPQRHGDHSREPRRYGHDTTARGAPVVTISPDDDAPERVARDFSGRRREGREAEWVHSVASALQPGADPLDRYEAQQRQLRLREEKERRLGAAPGAGAKAAPKRRYHAPWGLDPLVFVAGCSLGPVMLYAGFVYMRALAGFSGGAGHRGGKKSARTGGLPIL